jgi:hypothetical protein
LVMQPVDDDQADQEDEGGEDQVGHEVKTTARRRLLRGAHGMGGLFQLEFQSDADFNFQFIEGLGN